MTNPQADLHAQSTRSRNPESIEETSGCDGRPSRDRENRIEMVFCLLVSALLVVLWSTAMRSFGELARFPDEAKLLQASSLMAAYISEDGPKSFSGFLQLSKVWPPLTQALGATAFLIVQPSRAAATFMTVLLLSGTLLTLTRLRGLELSLGMRLLAIFTIALFLAPHTWLFMSDITLTCLVFVSILLLLTQPFASVRRSLVLGLMLGFGALSKWTFAFYLIFPLIMSFGFGMLAESGWRGRLRVFGNVFLAGTVGLIISLPWYIVNWHAQVALISKSSLDSVQAVGQGIPLAGLHVIGHQYLSPLFLLLAALSIARIRGETLQKSTILLAAVLGGTLITSWMDPLDDPSTYRYYLPALPLTILLAYSGLHTLPRRLFQVVSVLLALCLGYASLGLIGLSRNAPSLPPTWGTSIVYTDRIAKSHVGLLARPSSYLLERRFPKVSTIESMAASIVSSRDAMPEPHTVHVILRGGTQFPWAVMSSVWLKRPQQRMAMTTGVQSLASLDANPLRIGGWVLLESALVADFGTSVPASPDGAAQLFCDALIVVEQDGGHLLGFLSNSLMMRAEAEGSMNCRGLQKLDTLFATSELNWDDVILAVELSSVGLLTADGQARLLMDRLMDSEELGAMPLEVAIRVLALSQGQGSRLDLLRGIAEQVVVGELSDFPPREFHPGVDFLALKLTTLSESSDEMAATFFFRVRETPTEPLNLFLHGIPSSADCLPEERRASGFMNWYFIPEIDVSKWPASQQPFVLRRVIKTSCPDYRLSFGFYRPGGSPSTSYLKLGHIDVPKPSQDLLVRFGD